MVTRCGACRADAELLPFLDLGKTPLANRFPATSTERETWYPLQLARCKNCGLVQQAEVVPDEEIYGDDYGFWSGGSLAQREYHRRSADLLMARHAGGLNSHQGRRFTVEVACNDGSMLRHLRDAGVPCLGVDPSGPARAARDAGLPVLVEPFTARLARRVREEHGPAGLVVAYNALAHVADLPDVLDGVRELLADDGVAVVEVQYLPDLLTGNMYDQVYHEHRYFWSLSTFRRAAETHGLYVLDAELIELQGGGMRVTLSTGPTKGGANVQRILRTEQWLRWDSAYEGVQGRVDRARQHLLDLFYRELALGRTVYGYTAAAKATTILNFCGIGPDVMPFVVDSTPYKQGRHVPGTRIPIVAPLAADLEFPDESRTTRLLLAPNYLGRLMRDHCAYLQAGGRWLVPIPTPMVI